MADRVLSQLLIEMDGIEALKQVTVIAATNRPDMIDSALMRPGRIDRILYVAPPDFNSAKEIYDIELRKMSHSKDVDTVELARLSTGLSGAEIAAVCREAAVLAMEQNPHALEVEMRHFQQAASGFKPRITPDMLRFYAKFAETSSLQTA